MDWQRSSDVGGISWRQVCLLCIAHCMVMDVEFLPAPRLDFP